MDIEKLEKQIQEAFDKERAESSKDVNSPSPWNMRIWDEAKHQWLCDGEDDVLPYYGFDIRGGEVTAMQSMDWVYRQFEHGRKLIWERSTGLKDKNGKEIYEGDVVRTTDRVTAKGLIFPVGVVEFKQRAFWICNVPSERPDFTHNETLLQYWETDLEVIGNVHENPKLLGGEE